MAFFLKVHFIQKWSVTLKSHFQWVKNIFLLSHQKLVFFTRFNLPMSYKLSTDLLETVLSYSQIMLALVLSNSMLSQQSCHRRQWMEESLLLLLLLRPLPMLWCCCCCREEISWPLPMLWWCRCWDTAAAAATDWTQWCWTLCTQHEHTAAGHKPVCSLLLLVHLRRDSTSSK